ncbi:MAG: hypothetical protein MUC83_01365 [Pirellula sp.]|nr:hypothetical protein [Pirellula sp.]
MQHRSPGAIAGGLAFGTMLGLMPKDSLLALCILSLIAILPINQMIACLATVSLTFAESLTWGVTDWIGFHTLSLSAVSNLIGSIYQMPIAPWLRLENTVVMGALMLGLLLWGPCFLVTYRVSSRFQRSIDSDEVTALAAAALRHQSSSYTDPRFGSAQDEGPTHALQLDSVDANQSVAPIPSNDLHLINSQQHTVGDDLEERVLHETLIEVIRFKRPSTQQTTNDSVTPITSSSENKSMHLTNFIRKDSAETVASKSTLPGHNSTSPASVNLTQLHSHPHSKEDSLRNILKHIHTAREAKREVERSS